MTEEKLTDALRAVIHEGFAPDLCPKCGIMPYVYVKPTGELEKEGERKGEPVLLHYVKCNAPDCYTASPDMGGPYGRQRAVAEWNRRARESASRKF